MARTAKEIIAGLAAKRRDAKLKKIKSPLADLPDAGNLEANAKVELSAALTHFKAETAIQMRKQMLMTDTEYWVAVCFQSREQKEAFLKNAGLAELGDKYLDGQKVAKKLGVEVPIVTYKPPVPKPARGQLSKIPTLD